MNSSLWSVLCNIPYSLIACWTMSKLVTLRRLPLFYAFSFIGLDYTWIAFPVAETITTIIGFAMYIAQLKAWKKEQALEGDVAPYYDERLQDSLQTEENAQNE